MTNILFLISLCAFCALCIFIMIRWKERHARRLAKKLKALRYNVEYKGGLQVWVRSKDKSWEWYMVLAVLGAGKKDVIIQQGFRVPEYHPLKDFVADNHFFTQDCAAKTSIECAPEAIEEVLQKNEEYMDQEYCPMEWKDIHRIEETLSHVKKALKASEGLERLEGELSQLRGVQTALREAQEREWELKEAHEQSDIEWIEIEEGLGKGFHIGVVPLEEGDIGHKDSWKGLLKEKRDDDGATVQTTSPYKDGALEAIQEVVEIMIEEGSLEPKT